MKNLFTVALVGLLGSATPVAWAQPDQECEGKVMAAIKMLQIRSMMKGSEQKHGDLSIKDIENLQKTKGSCAAAKEIDERTKQGAKLGMF